MRKLFLVMLGAFVLGGCWLKDNTGSSLVKTQPDVVVTPTSGKGTDGKIVPSVTVVEDADQLTKELNDIKIDANFGKLAE